jgi:hypothetical protein
LVNNPAYSVLGGHYVPGMYHILALPIIKYLYSDDDTRVKLSGFSKAVKEQELVEKQLDDTACIANTHMRLDIFPSDVDDILEP